MSAGLSRRPSARGAAITKDALILAIRRAWDPSRSPARFSLAALTVVGLVVGVLQVAGRVPLPGDAWVYWTTEPGSYRADLYAYPPVLLQLLGPLKAVNAWQLYIVGWSAVCFAALGYALGPLALVELLLLVPDVLIPGRGHWWGAPVEAALLGNVTMPMAAAMIAGLRRSGWWAVPALSKMSPAVGLLWFPFRGEWRRFGQAVLVTGGVAVASFALAPAAWARFVDFALANTGTTHFGPEIVGPPLAIRLIAAVLLIAAAARMNYPRLVPIAAATALIGMYGWASFVAVACASLSPWLRAVPAPQTATPAE